MYKEKNRPHTDSLLEITRTLDSIFYGLDEIYRSGELQELLILGEFAPHSSEIDYLTAKLKVNVLTSHANIIISCDFENGRLFFGFSNVEMLKWQNREEDLIKSGIFYKNAKGDLYDGGSTILRTASPYINLTSKDLRRLRERYP
jgi:hypothetical protein